MAIGYMTVEINQKGEPRIQKDREGKEMLTFMDVSYTHITDIQSEALEMLRASIPKELKDVLVIFTFNYDGHGGGYFQDDYEDWLTVESHLLLKENYKEFYRHQVTTELKMVGAIDEKTQRNWELQSDSEEVKAEMDLLIGEWEEFYDEDFHPTATEKVAVTPLSLNTL